MTLKRFYSARFIIGMLFLVNPVISYYDILPDFVGFLLMFSALSEVAFLDERLETARRMTLYGAAISGARIALMFFALDINMDESGVLAIVFLLGAAELVAAVYFAVSFFGGISYVAQRSESDNILGDVDNVRNLWIAFWAVRVVSTVLPEFAALPQYTLQYYPDELPFLNSRTLLMYKNGITLILATISLILGIWWCYRTFKFIKAIKNDTKFFQSLSTRYSVFLKENPLQETFLACRTACVLFCIGCALQINFVLDGNKYVLPAWLGTAFFVVCLRWISTKGFKHYAPLCAVIAVQALCIYLPLAGVYRYISAVLLALCGFIAFELAAKKYTAYVKTALDWDMEGGFMLARIPLVLFLLFRAAHAIYPIYWFALGNIVCFTLWICIVLWVCVSLMSTVKQRRRL